jgi:carboxylesterase
MIGAEPFFHRGGTVGSLCLHGFTASPAEVRWLSAHLAGQGMTVYAPRLAGHGTDYHDMARMRWRDWYNTALDGYHILRQQCEHVFVAGLSMGGMLGLLLAASFPVDGLAAMATPVMFRSRRMANAHRFKYIRRYTRQPDRGPLPDTIRQEQARRGEAVLGRVRYDDWSTGAVAELHRLAQVVRGQLPQVTAPLLLVYSENDKTVAQENQAIIAGEVSSSVIEQHLLHNTDHILVQDVEREIVFGLVADFIRRQSSNLQ